MTVDAALNAYLARIGLKGRPQTNLAGLRTIHRAQGMTVPYEAIDVFAGHEVTQDIHAVRQKIIHAQRGGWCYETNGLLAWALTALGFQARRAAAAAYNGQMPGNSLGNHVVVLVTLDGTDWLCDLGLGDALREPIPLREGLHRQGPLTFRLERLPDGMWRFWNYSFGDPSNFVVDPGPADEDRIAHKHAALLADPESSFRQNFQVMQMHDSGSAVIYGRVLRRVTSKGVSKTLISGAAELKRLLDADFGLRGIAVEQLWPQIVARHAKVFGHPDAGVD